MAQQRTEAEEKQRIETERAKIAKGGFFHNAAVWLLSRFPLTKTRYQNWTRGRRILVGWLLWLVCLPIIPAVAIAVWYFNDPEGFKQSPWAKGLIGLFVVWLGAFGFIATNQAQPDENGIYSPIQTNQRSTESSDSSKTKASQESRTETSEGQQKSGAKPSDAEQPAKRKQAAPYTASEESRKKVETQRESNPTRGREFRNCTEAFEAGVFNIAQSDPSYQTKLDRDSDGIACER